MKRLFFLVMLLYTNFIHAEEAMEQMEVLKLFESFYDAMKPAEENSQRAFVWLTDIPHPLFNAVMHLSCAQVSTTVDALIEKTASRTPLSFWVHPYNRAQGLIETLKERDFAPVITCPLMVWSARPVTVAESDIRPANGDWEAFNQIIRTAFHFNELVKDRYAALLEKCPIENYLIYLGGKPVGTGSLFPYGQKGGIFNIATLAEYEGRGCARSMMQFLMHRAHQLGIQQLVLLSSPKAEGLYRSLEFKKIVDIDIYTVSIDRVFPHGLLQRTKN